MIKKIIFLFLALPIMAFSHVSSTGEKLLNTYWKDLKAGNARHISRYMDPHFQVAFYDGAANKAAELEYIASHPFASYTLSNIQETRCGSVLILTYIATVQHIEPKRPVIFKPKRLDDIAPRMTSWKKEDNHWKLISHANFSRSEA